MIDRPAVPRPVLHTACLTLLALSLAGCGGSSDTPRDDAADLTSAGQSGDSGVTSPGDGDGNEGGASGDEAPGLTSSGTGDSQVVEPGVLAPWDGTGELPPLPDPPLTPAPGPDSEPVLETDPVSTLSGLPTLVDPGGVVADPDSDVLSDADFDAGPLPAVLRVPDDVDVTGNTPPYFEGLTDQEVFAGDTLEVIFDPEDPDGGHPGMFPEHLPERAQYIDNFDGTRTLRWEPLQPDVGVIEFNIVAVDASEPRFRSARTVRIRVLMPDDPSGIRNLAPGINKVEEHVVRVGDPVVVALVGTDPNGTIPRLVLPAMPAGATFVPDRSEPRMSVLRFVPSVSGPIDLLVEAHDADNDSLVTRATFRIDVRARDAFDLPGDRLRNLARQRDLVIGFAAGSGFYGRPDGALFTHIGGAEFDLVTAENAMKIDRLNPVPGVWRWAEADNLVAWANSVDIAVHGHTLVWYYQLPDWLKRSEPGLREGHMRELIDRVMTRYRGNVPIWDVVNEAFEDDGAYRDSIWYEAMGERHVDIAFRQARQSDPSATLLYNDYDVSAAGPKADAMFRMLEGLVSRAVPIDGVGFQMHMDAGFRAFDEVREQFRRATGLGLEVYVTELDVSILDGQSEQDQALVYGELLSICLEFPACKAFQTWGFTDQHSWRRDLSPLPLDKGYAPKPAWLTLQRVLAD